jgi:hypothetical protein
MSISRESIKRRLDALEAAAGAGRPVLLWAMTPDCEPMTDAQVRELLQESGTTSGIPSQSVNVAQWLPAQG